MYVLKMCVKINMKSGLSTKITLILISMYLSQHLAQLLLFYVWNPPYKA